MKVEKWKYYNIDKIKKEKKYHDREKCKQVQEVLHLELV